jgi:hypothetical protein
LICINAPGGALTQSSRDAFIPTRKDRRAAMTRHLLYQDTQDDRRTIRRLGLVIGIFIIATAALAITVGVIMG